MFVYKQKFPDGITKPADAARSRKNVSKNRYKGLYACKMDGFSQDC